MLLLVAILFAADAPSSSTMVNGLKKLPAARGVSTDPAEGRVVVVDDKNGYLSVTEKEAVTEVALFTTATADKVWGVPLVQV